ncbi:MAG: hypothetical protein LJE61_08950 [Thiocapsa sp.]|nr:pilus assembly PilX N-terminal domain-containing protein [Thiocapsa sp.]MCG6985308.1 hypothetical protein [Thiocapsa sp.]
MMIRFVPKHARERGAVLVIALIMLLVTTLVAVSTFEMGSGNFAVVANLESQRQAEKAAEAALEEAITGLPVLIRSLTATGAEAPGAVFYCEGERNRKCYDFNGDGARDFEVDLTAPAPTCVLASPIPIDALVVDAPGDQGCFVGAPQTGAVDGASPGGFSLCSNSVWDLWARGLDLVTGAQARVRQGIGIRVSNNDIATACP